MFIFANDALYFNIYIGYLKHHERNSDYILPTMSFDRIESLIPSRDDWRGANLPQICLPIYTDGSKMEKGTGTKTSVSSRFLSAVFFKQTSAFTKAVE